MAKATSAQERECVICGERFRWDRSGPGRPRVRCDACKKRKPGYGLRPSGRRFNPECEVCGRVYRRSYSAQRTCGRACGVQLRRREGTDGMVNWPVSKVWFPNCTECREAFCARRSYTKLCSEQCRKVAHNRWNVEHYEDLKPLLLKHAHRRRARLAQVEWVDVDPLVVFERDGWMCGLCGEPVLREPRRKRDPLMASLDHVVPVARGGSHTYDNVQCAHLFCNLSKGAREVA